MFKSSVKFIINIFYRGRATSSNWRNDNASLPRRSFGGRNDNSDNSSSGSGFDNKGGFGKSSNGYVGRNGFSDNSGDRFGNTVNGYSGGSNSRVLTIEVINDNVGRMIGT